MNGPDLTNETEAVGERGSRYPAPEPKLPSPITPPDRRARSLRRTSTMQCFWPEGVAGRLKIAGTARDLLTGSDTTRIIGARRAEFTLSRDKRIVEIVADQPSATWGWAVGLSPGGALRKAIATHIPDELDGTTLLHRLLDDLGGATFMAGSAWYRWRPGSLAEFEAARSGPSVLGRSVEGLCISFQPGSVAMTPEGQTNNAISFHPCAPPPFRADDPMAWHALVPIDGPNHWRIRYTDIWIEDGDLRIAAGFQDSAAVGDLRDERILFHEYLLDAVVDPHTFVLKDIKVRPGSLPFSTCLAAPATARALIGQPLGSFGSLAPAVLAGTAGCTHLNEMLRNLRDVPAMAGALAHELSSEARA